MKYYNRIGVYINRRGFHKIWTQEDPDSWYVYTFKPELSDMLDIKEYDKIEYSIKDLFSIKIHKIISSNNKINI